jgi:PRTRC genetic system protein A
MKQRFLAEASAALPNEHAAWLVWDGRRAALTYQSLVAIACGPGAIQYHRPRLFDHESLAVDIHSHGMLPAFFSDTDDKDDRGAYKLAIVVGSFGGAELSVAMRLCLGGWFIDLPATTIPAKEFLCAT